jgi:hypothetical protein
MRSRAGESSARLERFNVHTPFFASTAAEITADNIGNYPVLLRIVPDEHSERNRGYPNL